MFAFRNQEKVCWHQCLYPHCLKKKKTSTTHSDHTVPSCPRQTKSRLSISQNWFSRDVLQKDEMCRMQHRKALRVCLSCAYKENGAVCLTPFVVAHLLGRSQHFHACTHANSTCTNPNYNPPSPPHTHSHPTYTYDCLESYKWVLKAKHLQCNKKNPNFLGCYWAALLSGWLCFPLGLLFRCLITFRTVLRSQAATANKIGFLKFLHHRFLFIFQLRTILHLPPGKQREAEYQLLQHRQTFVTQG